jgi:flagellar motor protein MotB
MAEQEEEGEKKVKCEDCKPGAPLWMATFADMATLLMAFFVQKKCNKKRYRQKEIQNEKRQKPKKRKQIKTKIR